MMGSDFYFRDKIPVAVLGATESIGQKLIQRLSDHPWFKIVALCDSEPFVGQFYGQFTAQHRSSFLPEYLTRMKIQSCEPSFACSLVFSGLNPKIAEIIETQFAEKGYFLLSRSSYALDRHVPQIVAKVNPDHLMLIEKQQFAKGKGKIVTIPTSAVIGLTLALKPLMDQFGLEVVEIVPSQIIYSPEDQKKSCSNGNNATHLISLEEDEAKIENESLRILGKLQVEGKGEEIQIQSAHFKINAYGIQSTAMEENGANIFVKLKNPTNREQIIQSWEQFIGTTPHLQLPNTSFHRPLCYLNQFDDHDLSDLHGSIDKQSAVKITNLQPCFGSQFDYKFDLFPLHPINGIVDSSLLTAEFLVMQGKIFW